MKLGRLVLSAATALALASPSPSPAGQDLSSLLAPPPASDWFEEASTPTTLDGPFTVHQYAAYLQAVGADNAQQAAQEESKLNRYGMTGGYGGAWEMHSGAQDLLEERVFAFQDSSGADLWYADLKDDSETSSGFVSEIPTEQAIPNSFGVVLKATSGTEREYRVEFKYQNLVFVVHADSLQNDLTTFALGQATKEWDTLTRPSPSPSAARAGSGAASIHTPTNAVTVALIAAGALVLLAIVIGVVLLLTQTRKRPAPIGYGHGPVQMSPDRAYWWDGVQWHPADSSTPPTAQRSPDGTHWWDGAAWRPVR